MRSKATPARRQLEGMGRSHHPSYHLHCSFDDVMTAIAGEIAMMDVGLILMPERRGLDLLATACEGDKQWCEYHGVKRKFRCWGVLSKELNR